jgi:hypothetical protein
MRTHPGQLELNFTFGRAEDTADRLTTYRQVCRQVGREFGLFPCFMPKPFMGVSANGCHHNFSLWQGDENMFMPEGDDARMPSKIGLHAIGGVLAHLRALTAITAPTVNSYRRFADAGILGSGLRRLGLPESDHGAAGQRAWEVRVPLGGLRREPVSLHGGPARHHAGRTRPEHRPGTSRRRQHLRRH